MNGKKHGGCSARGESTLRQAALEDVPHTPEFTSLRLGRDELLPTPFSLRPLFEVGVGNPPDAPLRGDVVAGIRELWVSRALRPRQKPVQFLVYVLRVGIGRDGVIDALIGVTAEGAYLRLLYV